MMAHHQYPINSCRLFERTKKEAISTLLKEQTRLKADEAVEEQQAASKEVHTGSVNEDAKKTKWKPEGKGSKSASQEVSGNGKKGAGLPTLKFLLVEGLGYGPSLSEHIILSAGLQPGLKMNSSILSRDEFEALAAAIKRFEDWLEAVVSGDIVPEGYIYMQKVGMGKAKSAASDVKEEFDRVRLFFICGEIFVEKRKESLRLDL